MGSSKVSPIMRTKRSKRIGGASKKRTLNSKLRRQRHHRAFDTMEVLRFGDTGGPGAMLDVYITD